MKKFESANKYQKSELSNWEINDENMAVRKAGTEKSIAIEDDKLRSDEMTIKVMRELKDKWYNALELDAIFSRREIDLAFNQPDNYIESINGSQENFPDLEDFVDCLENDEYSFKEAISKLEDKKEAAIQDRLEYQNTNVENFDVDLKLELEAKIKKIEEYINNGNKVIEFLQNKRISL